MQKFDSYIFDMDGTLWDAVDSYCAIWNQTIEDLDVKVPSVTRQQLASLMGTPLAGIFDVLIGDEIDRTRFDERLQQNSISMMPRLGGKLYEGVTDTIDELSKHARIFMVSNCDAPTLETFLDFTGLRKYMTDYLCFGGTGVEKDVNIRRLVEKHQLKNPVYVGDTRGDMESTHLAGIPFAWAAYGFGKGLKGQEYTLNSIKDLLS